jgi:hypothetical protein
VGSIAGAGSLTPGSGTQAPANSTPTNTTATSAASQTTAAAGQGAATPTQTGAAGAGAGQAGGAVIASAGTGGAVDETDYSWPSDCEQRYTFHAHATGSDTTKYSVPSGSQYYASFMFSAPWGSKDVQGLKFRSIIDNKAIVHHWILYGVDSANTQDGAVQGGPNQLFPISLPGEAFIQGWAPGAQDGVMPDGVGLHMASGATAAYRLEIHYYNSRTTNEVDQSGVEFCVTSKKRPIDAAVHWLGTASFSVPAHAKQDVVSTCKPNITNGPVHILNVSPHMHKTGVGAKAIINRANGTQETLLDIPFNFNEQRAHAVPLDGSAPDVQLMPGDTVTTTCEFNNTTDAAISFGEKTENEMCFFFTLAYPRGQLSNGLTSIIPGAEKTVNCLQ